VLLLLWRTWPPTVLYCPLKLTPAVRWTTIVTDSALTGAVFANLTWSSLNQGECWLTKGVTVTEPPAGFAIQRDAEIITCDGTILRANVCRPSDDKPHPVILCAHPYGKDALPRRRGGRWTYSIQYYMLRQPDPITFSALTGWEAPDPVWWVAEGFTVVNADLRGCGRSEGVSRLLSRQEAEDVYDVVQWAAEQPWSDGRVVMLGVSYLAISQYGTASLRPPALRAICPWEGFTDIYRDFAFPGGIREDGFMRIWSAMLRRSIRQSYDLQKMQTEHPLRDDFWRSLVPDLSAIDVPMLVCGSFSDHALHTRGSIRAFTRTGSSRARLYTHRGGKWSTFYSEAARGEQLAFFRSVLDGDDKPSRSVRLEVREDRTTVAAIREEAEWPLARTKWTPLYLAEGGTLATDPPPAAPMPGQMPAPMLAQISERSEITTSYCFRIPSSVSRPSPTIKCTRGSLSTCRV